VKVLTPSACASVWVLQRQTELQTRQPMYV